MSRYLYKVKFVNSTSDREIKSGRLGWFDTSCEECHVTKTG